MIIDCISDLHGYFPKLEGGDLLIVAGDLTSRDTPEEHLDFSDWLDAQPYAKKIVIAGNHDNNIDADSINCLRSCVYLQDSGTEFISIEQNKFNDDPFDPPCSKVRKLKIWGSPWTAAFHGMNPDCMAFTINAVSDTQERLCDKWELIPSDTDILITHSPALDILDKTSRGEHVGSKALHYWFKYVGRPKLHVCGHIHEGYGQAEVFATYDGKMMKSVNASHVNEHYKPVNKPIRIEL